MKFALPNDFVIVGGETQFKQHHDSSMLPVYDGKLEIENKLSLPEFRETNLLQSPTSNESITSIATAIAAIDNGSMSLP